MKEPVAELDSRFSDPDAEPTDWPAVASVLESAQLSWISTVRADGRPHATPLVAVWWEERAYFCTGPNEQKAVNLSHNPHVVLTTGCNDWEDGVDVLIEGEAKRVTDARRLERLAEMWADKWDGRWRFQPRDGGFFHDDGGRALVFEIAPIKILAFGKGTFSHTRYRFSD